MTRHWLAAAAMKAGLERLSPLGYASCIPAPTDNPSGTPRRLAAARTGRRSRTRTHDD
jgi:hypothetical protein